MDNREKIYDDEINPLMAKIIDICKTTTAQKYIQLYILTNNKQ